MARTKPNEPELIYSATNSQLPDRLWASVPSNDPRFTELRSLLARIPRRGKLSPVPRMLGEYALLGFLLTTGQIALQGDGTSMVEDSRQTLAELQAAQDHVANALSGMDFE